MPATSFLTPVFRSALLVALSFHASSLATAGLGGGVIDYELQKGPVYIQTAEDTQPGSPVGWLVFIAVIADPGYAGSATISGGGITGSLPLTYDDGEWIREDFYPDETALNAVYPSNATYTLTLSGGSLGAGSVSQNFTVPTAAYPNIPYLTGVDLTRAVNLDASEPFTLHWNSPGANADYVYLEFEEKEPGFEFVDGPELPGTATEGTVPDPGDPFAETLTPGKCYDAYLGFDHEDIVAADPAGFNAEGFIFHTRLLLFDLATILDRQPQPIVGAWEFGGGAANASGVLVFQENGIYFHAEDADDQPGDPDGMERGTYTWDENTGALTATPNVDTNGDLGLSAPIPSFTATIDGSTMMLSDNELTILQRVSSVSSPIEGGWRICDGGSNDTGVLVFLDNGSYFHAEIDDPGGMERGTYSWDAGTGALTATPLVDTNGDIGLSDPAGSFDATVFGMKVLTIFEGIGEFNLYRVTNAQVRADPVWRLIKGPLYEQTADNAASGPVEWDSYSQLDTRNPGDATAVSISGGGFAGSRSFDNEGPGSWTHEDIYASEAALDAEYPSNSSYTITVSGGELGTLNQDLVLGTKGYPNVPFLTGTYLTEAGEINPTEPFTLEWNDPGPLTAASGVTVLEVFEDLGGGEEGDQVYRDLMPGAWTTTTVPALTLDAGASLFGFLEATNAVAISGLGGFGPDGVTSHNTAIDFPMATIGGAAIVESFAEDAGLTGADALPEATPFDDGISNVLKYAFNMNVAGPDGGTLEGGTGTSGLPTFEFDQSVPDPVVKIEFVQRRGAGLVYTPKRSTTLGGGSFTPIVGSVTVTPIDENFDRVVVEDPCDPTVVPKCFWTIEVGFE